MRVASRLSSVWRSRSPATESTVSDAATMGSIQISPKSAAGPVTYARPARHGRKIPASATGNTSRPMVLPRDAPWRNSLDSFHRIVKMSVSIGILDKSQEHVFQVHVSLADFFHFDARAHEKGND